MKGDLPYSLLHSFLHLEFKPYMKLYYPYYLADVITNSLWASRVSLKPCNDARVCMKLPIRNIKGFKQHTYIYSYTQTHRQPDNQKKATLCCKCIGSSFFYSNEEQRFNYRIDQSHLAVFCIIIIWPGGPQSPVRIIAQVKWFMYQNRLDPSSGILTFWLAEVNKL